MRSGRRSTARGSGAETASWRALLGEVVPAPDGADDFRHDIGVHIGSETLLFDAQIVGQCVVAEDVAYPAREVAAANIRRQRGRRRVFERLHELAQRAEDRKSTRLNSSHS